MDLRQRVVPDASQLCAVSLHAGASSRTVSAQYDWNYLAAAPCILISMGNAYCYEISRCVFLSVSLHVLYALTRVLNRHINACTTQILLLHVYRMH